MRKIRANECAVKTPVKKPKSKRIKFTGVFIGASSLVIVSTMILISAIVYTLMGVGIIKVEAGEISGYYLILFVILSSIVLGTAIAAVASKIAFKSIDSVAQGMETLSSGDFGVRVGTSRFKETKRLMIAFNKLASELENISVLRSDFVNEFAHEFKTPIVSIKGFAELLKDENISYEQKKEYLSVIIEEADRLSSLSVNALNMSKVEKQSILTDVSTYDLSEQIRNSILLLEKKWMAKNLDLQVDFDEYQIDGNEELLKQVWINLLDNAIKFSDENGKLTVAIENIDYDKIKVIISNEGQEIKEEDIDKIFDKFYRAKESMYREGSGIGLAVVKKIVELHNGEISVTSKNGVTSFYVMLTNTQKIN